ncbi:MAG: hypothetical protein JXR25_17480 [Pontiellaceae bacterium]|nr:hypothetical protein [Pontiellaceae bacterium]MBN2786612.1 hypothetical protein [Pontiellaceae bacterium]
MKKVSGKTVFLICCMLAGAVQSVHAAGTGYDVWVEDFTAQGLIGAVRFDHLEFNIADSADARTTHLSTLPQIGGAWGTLPIGERLQFGLETAFLVGFQVDKINYLRLGGGGLQVSLSTTLWLFDLSGGAYANLYLDEAKRVRLYAGAGPLMMYANYRNDRSFSDNSDSEVETYTAFGVGAYARAGVEYRVENFGMVGLAVRSQWADIDLQDAGGSDSLYGTAVFATFTAGF